MPTRTRAIVSYGPHQSDGWKLRQIQLRPLRENELLVEIVASGVCQTDLHFGGASEGFGVHYPRVMGHEGAGYVREVGQEVSAAQPGDAVVLSFASCQSCDNCQDGRSSYCMQFNHINFTVGPHQLVASEESDDAASQEASIYGQFFGQSSFSNWTIVRQDSVVNVSQLVKSREELALFAPLGCGVQTGSGAIVNAAKAKPIDRVVVLGVGGVGLGAVMAANLRKCRIIVAVDRIASRLQLARELGATHVIDTASMASLTEVVDTVLNITGGLGASITLDTTGLPKLIEQGLRLTGVGGKMMEVGVAPETATLSIPILEFMSLGKQYMGVIEGNAEPRQYVPAMIGWHRDGQFPLEKIVRQYPAEAFEQAIQDMRSGKTVKPVLVW